VTRFARDWPRSIVVDSGVLVAAIDADERDHRWAKRVLTTLVGSFFTCEACITEAVHLLDNSAPAVDRLSRLVERMTVVSFVPDAWRAVLAEVVRRSPSMDYADACVVRMVNERRDAFALTLDRRDFSSHGVPFACPAGNFYL
jgi:predicted nucleic acid-binding protein